MRGQTHLEARQAGKRLAILRSDDAHHLYLESLLRSRFAVSAVVVEPSSSQRRQLLRRGRYVDYAYAQYHRFRRTVWGLNAYRQAYFADLPAPPETGCCKLNVDWINSPSVVQLLEEVRPDLTVTICTSILREEVLGVAGTIVNVHGGLLPFYRGNHCFFFPFSRGEFGKLGSTLHFVDRGIDTGDILERIVPWIDRDDTPEKLYCRAEKIAIQRLGDWIEHWQQGGELPREPQQRRYPLCRTRDRTPYHDVRLWARRHSGRLVVPKLPATPLPRIPQRLSNGGQTAGSAALPRARSCHRLGDGILATIGNTPLVRLGRLFPGFGFSLFAKIEGLNPGGSVKDRPAIEILQRALRSGSIGPRTVVVESSSGNMGIGLAQACRFHGLRFVCVVDPKTSLANLNILAAYGAEVERVTAPDPVSGEYLQARIGRVQQLMREIPNSFWPNQYANADNAGAHYRTTMAEVVNALDGPLDYLFVATSTCGTIRGCCDYVRDHRMSTRIVAVDAVGSLIFKDRRAPRLLPGLGASFRPPLCDTRLIETVVNVSDADCVAGCRLLVEREAILAGASSGGVVSAIERLHDRIAGGACCVAIFPDRGDRYLDTVFDDRWVARYCSGAAPHVQAGEAAARNL